MVGIDESGLVKLDGKIGTYEPERQMETASDTTSSAIVCLE
jgi:hypothetical protein